MQDVDSSSLSNRLRKGRLRGQVVGFGLAIFLVPALLSISPEELVRQWCPANAFYTRASGLGWSFGPAVLLALCFPFLLVLLLSRVDLSAWLGAISTLRPRGRYFTP